jgi:DNA-binding MarR family transcriptional regulator
MLHLMRSIDPTTPGAPLESPAAEPTDPASLEAILTEVHGWVGELRCASMARMVQGKVSLGHMHVLWLLQHHGEMPMNRLADLLGVSFSNATGLIDRMEERGLIERVRVPDDRRLVLVRPAPGGLHAISETETSKRERMRAVLSHLSAAERPVVLAALRSLRRALSVETESSGAHDEPNAGHRHHFTDGVN